MPSSSRLFASVALSLFISWYGVRRRSLSLSGGLAAIIVGVVLTAASGCFCLALLGFFLTSSRLTKWKASEKKRLEHDYKEGEAVVQITVDYHEGWLSDLPGGQRDWVQVLCNGGVATIAALCYIGSVGYGEHPFFLTSSTPSMAAVACITSLACSCGDTWASEVGGVVGGTPYLVTTWRRVPRGTNGGVTLVGTLCSVAGGLVVGGAYFIGLLLFVGFGSTSDALTQASVVLLGGVAGLWGSLVDSLLGATVQYSGWEETGSYVVHGPVGKDVKHISGWDILDNHAVNFVSSALTAATFAILTFVFT